jgi:hypothetical protein
MIQLLVKLFAIVLLIALAIVCFIKLLPWCIATLALLALVKFGHAWLCRQGFPPSAWWPWKKDDGQQPNAVPQ